MNKLDLYLQLLNLMKFFCQAGVKKATESFCDLVLQETFSVLYSVKINCIEPAVFKNLICDILDFILWNCFFAQFLFDNKARLSKHTLHLRIIW